jgi:hypothetical protein
MTTAVSHLLAEVDQSGGWGLAPEFASDSLDTALALTALAAAGASNMSQVVDALSFLVTHQNLDGGWGCVVGGPSDISCTAQVLIALNTYSNQFFLEPVTIPARHFLKAALHPDGSIGGIATDSIYTTALAARTLVEAGDELGNDRLTIIAFLQSGQGADGSWGGDPFLTAVALRALAGLLQVAPTVEAGTDQTAMEGEPVSLLGANFTDLSILDTHTATIDWGDGTVESGTVITSDGNKTVSGSHTYADEGALTVEVCVTDSDGRTDCDTFQVTVFNVAPIVEAGIDRTVAVGVPVNLVGANFTDQGTLDTHTTTIDWGDGTVESGTVYGSGGTGTVSGSHTYAAAGIFPIDVCVTDDDGGTGCDSLQFTTLVGVNVPVIISSPITIATVGQLYSYDVEATEPDAGDVLTFSLEDAPTGMTIDPATGLTQWTPTNLQEGNRQVTVRVENTGGLFDLQRFTVTAIMVNPSDLVVTLVDRSSVIGNWQNLAVSGSVTAEVVNQGIGPAVGEFTITFFEDFNANTVFDPGMDTVLGSAVQEGLDPDATVLLSSMASGAVAFRDNLIYAFVDSSGAIAESNETNNISHTGLACKFAPIPGSFTPVLEWSWAGGTTLPSSQQVMMTPAVIDLTADGVPDVIFASFTGSNFTTNGHLRAVNGNDGSKIFTVTDLNYNLRPGGNIAVGDIDLDSQAEILAVEELGARIIAFEHDGTFKWRSPAVPGGINFGGPAIADLDRDGFPEIVVGATVLNHDGTVRWIGSQGVGEAYAGPLSLVVNLDLQGDSEVMAGNTAYRSDGSIYWHNSSVRDGLNAVGNFDTDPFPEVVLVTHGLVYLLAHDGTIQWGPVPLPGGGVGGPPTVADVDGDGEPEIGVAGSTAYAVFEADGTLKWQRPVQDYSSQITGSSVFDFEGDGAAEIIYGDELKLRIYRGSDGTVLWEIPSPSGTLYELPIIVDVDADGNAEIVMVSNNYLFPGPTGIQVYGDANHTWVPTRNLWNQHTYHVTNILDDGTIPAEEANNWETLNNYRQNVQTVGSVFASADVTASFLRTTEESDGIVLTTRIGNGGAKVIGPGLPVSFYDGDSTSGGVLLGTANTTSSLLPGQFEDVSITLPPGTTSADTLWVVADDSGGLVGLTNECDETNNALNSGLILTIFGANGPPEIASTPVTTAIEGQPYSYDVESTDSDAGNVLTFALQVSPAGMTIDPATGLIQR